MRALAAPLIALALAACHDGAPRPPAPASAPSASPSPPSTASSPPPLATTLPAASTSEPADAGSSGPMLDLSHAVWSPDRTLIATLIERRVHLWDGATKAHLHELDDTMVEEALFSHDSKRLFLAHVNSPPAMVENLKGTPKIGSFGLAKGIATEGDRGCGLLALTKDGAWLAGRCNTMDVCLWSTKTWSGRKWTQDVGVELTSVAFAQDDRRLVVKNEAGTSYELDVPSLRRVR